MRPKLLRTLTLGLVRAGRTWRRAADEVVTAYGLTEATALPLLLVSRLGGDLRQTALAEALGVEGPTLVRLLDQVEEAGLVTRQEDPTDRRAKVLRLTKAGRARVGAIEAEFDRLRERIFADVPDADLEATLRVLQALRDGAGDRAGPDLALPEPRRRAAP
jgi:MarR family transcriptional regulator, transcriptional regulator for hemolysin